MKPLSTSTPKHRNAKPTQGATSKQEPTNSPAADNGPSANSAATSKPPGSPGQGIRVHSAVSSSVNKGRAFYSGRETAAASNVKGSKPEPDNELQSANNKRAVQIQRLYRSFIARESWGKPSGNGSARAVHDFAKSRLGKHWWASDVRTPVDGKKIIARADDLGKSFVKKAKKSNLMESHDERPGTKISSSTYKPHHGTQPQYGKNNREHEFFVHSPLLMSLSPNSSPLDKCKAKLDIHSDDAAINCVQFACYSLWGGGAISQTQLKALFAASAQQDSLAPLHEALGVKNGDVIDSKEKLELIQAGDIIFEVPKNRIGDASIVSHMLIGADNGDVIDIAWGAVDADKEDWRVSQWNCSEEDYPSFEKGKVLIRCSPEEMQDSLKSCLKREINNAKGLANLMKPKQVSDLTELQKNISFLKLEDPTP